VRTEGGDEVSIKANTRLALGTPVQFRIVFQPETKWIRGGWYKSWRGYLSSEQPRRGIFLGWRTVYDGNIWYGNDETDPTSFTPSGSHRVMLIAYNVRRNPVYVRGEDAEIAESVVAE
jgi:hypothetical protein